MGELTRRWIRKDILKVIEGMDWRTELEEDLGRRPTANQKLERALELAIRVKKRNGH